MIIIRAIHENLTRRYILENWGEKTEIVVLSISNFVEVMLTFQFHLLDFEFAVWFKSTSKISMIQRRIANAQWLNSIYGIHPIIVKTVWWQHLAQLQIAGRELEMGPRARGPRLPGVKPAAGLKIGARDLEKISQGIQVGKAVLIFEARSWVGWLDD